MASYTSLESLTLLICKMGIITAPPSQDYLQSDWSVLRSQQLLGTIVLLSCEYAVIGPTNLLLLDITALPILLLFQQMLRQTSLNILTLVQLFL